MPLQFAIQRKQVAVTVTIAKDQMKKIAAVTLVFSAGSPVQRTAPDLKEYLSFSYVEPEPELNIGLIAGASVGK